MTRFVDRPLVYLAGPYTNPDPSINVNKTIAVAEELQDSGLVTCFIPHLTHLWHVVHPHEDVHHWYEYDLAMLARCDALYRIPGKSSGADAEVEFARARSIPVIYEQPSVLTWARLRPKFQ